MSSDELLYREENGVAWLTINRPDNGNSMTPEIRDGMRDIINGFNGQYKVRAAVITATGEKMFCPGADIKTCLLYTSPSPRDRTRSRMPSSA